MNGGTDGQRTDYVLRLLLAKRSMSRWGPHVGVLDIAHSPPSRTIATMPSTPPTPPATQAPALHNNGDPLDLGTNSGVVRHSHFYEESENLKDGVILRVSYPLVLGCEAVLGQY